MIQYKIEKGIPITNRMGNKSDTVRKMKEGDSIVMHPSQLASFRSTAHRLKIKITSRNQSATETRIWRTQ